MALTLMYLYNFQSLACYKNRKYAADVFALLNQITNNHSLLLGFQISIMAIGKEALLQFFTELDGIDFADSCEAVSCIVKKL